MQRHRRVMMIVACWSALCTPVGAQSTGSGERLRLNRTIQQLELGQPVFGAIVSNHSYETGRMLKSSGLDFISIDMEHQVYDYVRVRSLLLGLREQPFSSKFIDHLRQVAPEHPATAVPPTPMLKITRLGREGVEFDVRHALKLGALGVFIPYVESRAEIEAAVRAARAPETDYVIGTSEEDTQARNGPWPLYPKGEFLIGAMIESLKGEHNIEEILDTPGLGAVWIAHPSSSAVERRILRQALDRGLIVACSDYDPANFRTRLSEGYKMMFLAWDDMLFARGLQQLLDAARAASQDN